MNIAKPREGFEIRYSAAAAADLERLFATKALREEYWHLVADGLKLDAHILGQRSGPRNVSARQFAIQDEGVTASPRLSVRYRVLGKTVDILNVAPVGCL